MGSTHTCKQTAYAARAKDGQVFYFLEESTFESNVYPKTPHSCMIFMGSAQSCMSRVIEYSSACEGGSLKGASGWIKPESYVQKWNSALKSALEIDASKVVLEFSFGDGSFRDGIYKIAGEKRANVEAWLQSAGVQPASVVNAKVNGYSVPLQDVAHALDGFKNLGISVWQVVGGIALTLATTGRTLPYVVHTLKAGQCDPGVSILKIPKADNEKYDDKMVLIRRADGNTLTHRFAAVESLIGNEVVKAELELPGTAIHMIGVYREAVANAPVIDGELWVTVSRSHEPGRSKWSLDCYDKLAAKLNVTGTTFTVKMKDILSEAERVRLLNYVGMENVKFGEIHSPGVQARQPDLDLLAA